MSETKAEKGDSVEKKTRLCRGCMEDVGKTGKCLELELQRMFTACTGLEVTDCDGLPLCVCSACEIKICYCYEFISCCKKTDVSLRKIHTNSVEDWNCQIVKLESFDHDVSEDDLKPTKIDEDYVYVNIKTETDNNDATIEEKIDKVCIEKKLEKKRKFRNDAKKSVRHKINTCVKSNGKFICFHCSKEFSQRSYLRQHLIVHDQKKPFTCEVCNKTYKKPSLLKMHQRLHTGERNYKCDVCNMTFSLKSSLQIHSKQHDGTRHICDLCGMDFTQLGNLKVHMRIHTGEKPFACSKCTYRCTSHSGIRRHERVHSNSRPYNCTVCLKSFSSVSSHTRHNRIHTGELPYKCSYCSKAFIDSWKRKKHMVKVHNIAMTDIPQLSGGRKRIYNENGFCKDEIENTK